MNEKLKMRLAEIEIWGQLADTLDSMRRSECDALQMARDCLDDSPAEWELRRVEDRERKIKAMDAVCAAILKQIG